MPTMPAAFPAARGACPREWPREVPLASARHVGAGFSPRLTGVVCLWRRQPPGAMSGHARPFPSSLPWTQGTLGLSWVHLSHRRGVCPPSPACPASLNDPGGGGEAAGWKLAALSSARAQAPFQDAEGWPWVGRGCPTVPEPRAVPGRVPSGAVWEGQWPGQLCLFAAGAARSRITPSMSRPQRSTGEFTLAPTQRPKSRPGDGGPRGWLPQAGAPGSLRACPTNPRPAEWTALGVSLWGTRGLGSHLRTASVTSDWPSPLLCDAQGRRGDSGDLPMSSHFSNS